MEEWKKAVLALVLYTMGAMNLHISAKNLLYKLAFAQKSETNIPLISERGMVGIFLLHKVDSILTSVDFVRIVTFISHS